MRDKEINAQEYFDYVKSKKQEITRDNLKVCLENMTSLAVKFEKTGQLASLERLRFLTGAIIQEETLFDFGLTKFIYREDVSEYINEVAKDTVKIIDLENYIRDIPDEIVEVIEKTKDIFSQMYVLYTDYTGKEEKRVEASKRSKDPILFGCFREVNGDGMVMISDRFYILGDWEDEYCDLTLDKMVSEMKTNPVKEDIIPTTKEGLLEHLNRYKKSTRSTNGDKLVFTLGDEIPKKPSFFQKVRSFFRK